ISSLSLHDVFHIYFYDENHLWPHLRGLGTLVFPLHFISKEGLPMDVDMALSLMIYIPSRHTKILNSSLYLAIKKLPRKFFILTFGGAVPFCIHIHFLDQAISDYDCADQRKQYIISKQPAFMTSRKAESMGRN